MRFDPLIFVPGYSELEISMKNALFHLPLHHREERFREHLKSCKKQLKNILQMEEIILLSCSGTGVMEACVSTFCENPLCISNGKFGDRFIDIANALNLNLESIKKEWNEAPTIDEIKNAIMKNKKIDSICMQICDSSSGIRIDVESISKEIKNLDSNILVIADGIASIGAEKIETNNIDVLIASPSKAFCMNSGVGIIGLSKLAIEKMKEGSKNKKSFYFDLSREFVDSKDNSTSFTPIASTIISLDKYLKIINLEEIYSHIRASSMATRESLKAIGLEIYPKNPAPSISVIHSKDSRMIIELLEKEYNIKIASGQDKLRDKVFRINHMGRIPLYKLLWLINAIELILEKLNIRKFNGCSNRIFLDSYYKGISN